jgi:O-acetylhomoserine/O-acetylserine sulfhydrylase-like pyridoxal-dependent enzyme
VHLPPAPVPAQQPLGTPVYRTTAFRFSTSAEYAAVLGGQADGYSYPGLVSHPGHETARKLFDGGPEGTRFGAIVTVTPRGGREGGFRFADRLRVAQVATSLGGTRTKVSHVASTTHRQLDDAALAAAGIDPGAVRFSIGLEDAADLIADAHQALDALR